MSQFSNRHSPRKFFFKPSNSSPRDLMTSNWLKAIFIFLRLINDTFYEESKFTFNSVINSVKLYKIKKPNILLGFFTYLMRWYNSCRTCILRCCLFLFLFGASCSLCPYHMKFPLSSIVAKD